MEVYKVKTKMHLAQDRKQIPIKNSSDICIYCFLCIEVRFPPLCFISYLHSARKCSVPLQAIPESVSSALELPLKTCVWVPD